MNTEEKIFALMAAAEEQQKLTTRLIELQRKEAKEHIEALKKERAEMNERYKQEMHYCASKVGKEADYWFMAKTAIACISIGLIVLIGMWFYGEHLTKKVIEADAAYSQLEKYNADISTCSGEPCVRVMVSKGAYGNSRDYFILDPK